MKALLLVLLFISTILTAEDTRRAGKPTRVENLGYIESAILAPDGKSFYTIRKNILAQWSLNPLKKLNLWELPISAPPTGKYADIYIANNKILVATRDELILFNIQKQTVEKRLLYKTFARAQENNLLYLVHQIESPETDEEGVHYKYVRIEMWDIDTLTKIKTLHISYYSDVFETEMWLNHQYLYFFSSYGKVLIIDKKDLQIKNEYSTHLCDQSGHRLGSVLTNEGHFVIGRNIYKQSDGTLLKTFDPIESCSKATEEEIKLSESYRQKTIRRFPANYRSQGSASQVGNLELSFKYGHIIYVFSHALTDETLAYIFYENGELLMINENGYFETTTPYPSYLGMYDENLKKVPITKEVYEKYNKQLTIKGN